MGNFSSTEPSAGDLELDQLSHDALDDQREDMFSTRKVGVLRKQPTNCVVIIDSRWKHRVFSLQRGGLVYGHVTGGYEQYDLTTACNIQLGEATIVDSETNTSAPKILVSFTSGTLLTLAMPIHHDAERLMKALRDHSSRSRSTTYQVMAYAVFPGQGFQRAFIALDHHRCRIWPIQYRGHFPLTRNSQVDIDPVDHTVFSVSTPGKTAEQSKTLICKATTSYGTIKWRKAILEMCSHVDHQDAACDHYGQLAFYNTLHDVLDHGKRLKRDFTIARRPFFILSIDGGGTRGIIPCVVLQRLAEIHSALLDRVDMMAGTSNGAMLALGLAFGHAPKTIREMMTLTAGALFSEMQGRYSLTTAKWSSRYLEMFCSEVWKDATMKDCPLPVVVPAFHLPASGGQGGGMKLFTNADLDLVKDVLMRTCAAPTYFPAWQNHVDGGVFAHNPADLAVAHAVNQLKIPLDQVVVLSLSTGKVTEIPKPENPPPPETGDGGGGVTHNYGYYQWASLLPRVLWDGMIEKTNHLCGQLLGTRFHRLNVPLDEELAMDQPDLIPAMIKLAENASLEKTSQFLMETKVLSRHGKDGIGE